MQASPDLIHGQQFTKMEHLVEHMRTSFHSNHEPICVICHKHCLSFESLREHLIGPLPKAECERIFKDRGCDVCLNIFSSRHALHHHRDKCHFSRGSNGILYRMANLGIQDELRMDNARGKVVSMACKMVGGGSDGSLDLCARVCLIDEHQNLIFHTYVNPNLPVTLMYEMTGIRPEYLRDATPVRQVGRKIQDYLCNGEPIWQIRDTARYPPLMKTSKLSNSLKYLTRAYLGYEIQNGVQDPYEDSVATMRLYKRMRSQDHRVESYPLASDQQNRNNFASWRQLELERMSPERMLEMSRSDYYCWCLDSK
ncbi:hypothetical protein SASPL_146692 [Salvia splendens]|uniref:C2H2-type domain-containing protein n=1 Tax=Salvia splendens TaxID=180675 RepID=A0A8X8Z5T5_SALSN|nr:hypothetical protein SASPL_146692 [Salvia splendens]